QKEERIPYLFMGPAILSCFLVERPIIRIGHRLSNLITGRSGPVEASGTTMYCRWILASSDHSPTKFADWCRQAGLEPMTCDDDRCALTEHMICVKRAESAKPARKHQ